MESKTCRYREDCTSLATFECECTNLNICQQCLVDHMQNIHNIELVHADEIFNMINQTVRNRQYSCMNKFTEFINSLRFSYSAEVSRSSALIKNEFITKTNIITSIADSVTNFLKKPLECPMIRINERNLPLFDAYFSTDLQRENILKSYALESIYSLQQKIHEKEEASEKLKKLVAELLEDGEVKLENSRKQIQELKNEYKGENKDLKTILEQRNSEIEKLTDEGRAKIKDTEEIIEQRNKEIEKLKAELEKECVRTKRSSIIETKINNRISMGGNCIVPPRLEPKGNSCFSIPKPVGVNKPNDRIEELGAKDKENQELNKIIKQKEDAFISELIAKENRIQEFVAKINELEKANKENHEEFTAQLMTKETKIKQLEQSIKQYKESLDKAHKEHVEHGLFVRFTDERNTAMLLEIQGLKYTVESNLEMLNKKDIRIRELEQSTKDLQEAFDKYKEERNAMDEMKIQTLQQNFRKSQEDYRNQCTGAFQTLQNNYEQSLIINREIGEALRLAREEIESHVLLSRSLLIPFENFPNIRGSFALQKPNEFWPMPHGIDYLCLSTHHYNIISIDRVSINLHNRSTNQLIFSYNTNDKMIKKIFASADERFILIEGTPKVYLLEILDHSRIEMKDSYEQIITNVMCNNDSTCLITYNDTAATVLDLVSRKRTAGVAIKLF